MNTLKNKKFIFLLVTIALLASLLISCSNNDTKKPAEATGTQVSTSKPNQQESGNTNAPTSFTATVASVSATAGSEIKVPITISNNPGVCAFYVSLSFPKELKLKGVDDGGVLSSPLHKEALESPYILTWDDSLEANKNNGDICTLLFEVADNVPENTELELTLEPLNGGIIDFDLNDLPINIKNGKVTITAS